MKGLFLLCLLTSTLFAATKSDTICNNRKPSDIPQMQLDAVNVIPSTGEIELIWTPVTDEMIAGYVVYRNVYGSNVKLDTIEDKDLSSYITERVEQAEYTISMIDICGNIGTFGEFKKHFVADIKLQQCVDSLEIMFTNAKQSIVDIEHFEVFVKEDGNAFEYKTQLNVDQNVTKVPISANVGTVYCYVTAVAKNTTTRANSPVDTAFDVKYFAPIKNYIANVSAVDKSNVEVKFSIDKQTQWIYAKLFNNDDTFLTIPFEDYSGNDTTVYFPLNSEIFNIKIFDNCDNVIDSSNNASIISLTGEITGNDVFLKWTEYSSWLGDVENYSIYKIANNDTFLLHTVADDGRTEYTYYDIIDASITMNLVYFVVAAEGEHNPFFYREVSKSNEINLIEKHEVPIEIPTGFVINGYTKEYKPWFVPLDEDILEWHIINNFGQTIFSSQSLTDTWDGTFGGEVVPQGVYICQVLITRFGTTTKKVSAFVVIRK